MEDRASLCDENETNDPYVLIAKARFPPFHPNDENGFPHALFGLVPPGLGELSNNGANPLLASTDFSLLEFGPPRISDDPPLL